MFVSEYWICYGCVQSFCLCLAGPSSWINTISHSRNTSSGIWELFLFFYKMFRHRSHVPVSLSETYHCCCTPWQTGSCLSLQSSWPVCLCPGWAVTGVWSPAYFQGEVWRTWACHTRSLTPRRSYCCCCCHRYCCCYWKWQGWLTWPPEPSSSLLRGCLASRWRRWKHCDWCPCQIWLHETNLLLAWAEIKLNQNTHTQKGCLMFPLELGWNAGCFWKGH